MAAVAPEDGGGNGDAGEHVAPVLRAVVEQQRHSRVRRGGLGLAVDEGEQVRVGVAREHAVHEAHPDRGRVGAVQTPIDQPRASTSTSPR